MSLDVVAWRAVCEDTADLGAKRCGLSHGYYVDLFSAAIDGPLGRLPEEDRTLALQIAREWDYATPVEREDGQQWNAENGFCTHGIEFGCCPAGCGSGPDD